MSDIIIEDESVIAMESLPIYLNTQPEIKSWQGLRDNVCESHNLFFIINFDDVDDLIIDATRPVASSEDGLYREMSHLAKLPPYAYLCDWDWMTMAQFRIDLHGGVTAQHKKLEIIGPQYECLTISRKGGGAIPVSAWNLAIAPKGVGELRPKPVEMDMIESATIADYVRDRATLEYLMLPNEKQTGLAAAVQKDFENRGKKPPQLSSIESKISRLKKKLSEKLSPS